MWVRVPLKSLKLQISHLFWARSSLPFRQLYNVDNSELGTWHDKNSQMHGTDKYSQHSSTIWLVWLNGWGFVYELSGYEFESRYSHLNCRSRACFEQGVPWHSGNYRVWTHSETRTWHYKDIQSNAPYRKVLTTLFNYSVSLAKWMSACLRTKWLLVRVPLESLEVDISRQFRGRGSLTFRQL